MQSICVIIVCRCELLLSSLQSKAKTNVSNPIRSSSIFDRFQIDLIDMRHNKIYLDSRQYVDKHLRKKDKEAKRKEITEKKEERHYEWMAHVVDHFSKYHVIWAQETKTMEETGDNFESRVLAYFGLPRLLHRYIIITLLIIVLIIIFN